MELKLYNCLDNDNVINKTLILQYTINIKLKDNFNIVNPTLLLSDSNKTYDFSNSNYCYLSDFKRFYFVRDIDFLHNGIIRLTLECDVLESFKNDILNSNCNINRNIGEGDFNNVNVDTDLRKDITIYESDIELNKNKIMILSSIGV